MDSQRLIDLGVINRFGNVFVLYNVLCSYSICVLVRVDAGLCRLE